MAWQIVHRISIADVQDSYLLTEKFKYTILRFSNFHATSLDQVVVTAGKQGCRHSNRSDYPTTPQRKTDMRSEKSESESCLSSEGCSWLISERPLFSLSYQDPDFWIVLLLRWRLSISKER
jgi:hypothetical protein